MDDVDTRLQITGVEHSGKVLSLFDGEVTRDFGVTVRNLVLHGRGGIDELVKHDGDTGRIVGRALGSCLAGDLAPLFSSLVFHGHSDDHAVVLVNILTGIADHTCAAESLRAQQGSHTVVFLSQRIERICGARAFQFLRGAPIENDIRIAEDFLEIGEHLVNLRHVSLTEVSDDIEAAGDGMAEDRALANLFIFVLILVIGIHRFRVLRRSEVGVGIQRSIEGSVSLRLGFSSFRVLELFGQFGIGFHETLLDGLASHHVSIDFPELQFGGALQQVSDTLGFLHTGQFHEDTAALQHLQVGLCHTETVDTGAQDLERAIDNLATLLADEADNLIVSGILDTGALAEIGAQVGIVHVLRLLLRIEALHENIDKVTVHGLGVLGLRLLESVLEQRVLDIHSQALHSVGDGDLQRHIHTAFQVQTQVQFFVLTLFVSVSEIDG